MQQIFIACCCLYTWIFMFLRLLLYLYIIYTVQHKMFRVQVSFFFFLIVNGNVAGCLDGWMNGCLYTIEI